MKYIYIILLLFATSAVAQTFGLVKDKEKAEAVEDYIIRPPKMNYAALCQENNLLNDDKIKGYLEEEAQGRFNAESYFHLAKIYYYGLGAVFQDKTKAMKYAQDAADIPSTWRKQARNLVGKMQLKALKSGDESMQRELQNTISMMMQEDVYAAGYYAGQMAEMEEDYVQSYAHYRTAAAKNPQASLAIAMLYYGDKLPNGSKQKTSDMVKIAQNQLLEELNGGDCNALMAISDMFLNSEVMKPQLKIGLEWLQVALSSGYGQAGVRLGEHYMAEKQSELARNSWQQASDLGSKRAMFLLADDALKHNKTKQAIRQFIQSGNLNYLPAISKLMEIYQGEHGAKYADAKQLQHWKQKASDAPNPPTELLRENGLSMRSERNYELSLKMLSQAAYGGSKVAWLDLSVAHRYGYGVRADLAKSFQHVMRAAKMGSAAGANDLSKYYNCGIGTSKDLAKADFWQAEARKRQSLQKLDAPLQNTKSKNAQTEHFLLLQKAWRNNSINSQDLQWLKAAAQTHHKQSALLLGNVYAAADDYNAELAIKYYEIAAHLGSQPAMLRLSALPNAKHDWLNRAEAGVFCAADVMFEAANHYDFNSGEQANQAKQYLIMAAKRGSLKAAQHLQQLQQANELAQSMNAALPK